MVGKKRACLIVSAILFLSLLTSVYMPGECMAADTSSYGIKIDFKSIDNFTVSYLSALLGTDASQFRTEIDSTYGNSDAKVTSNEVLKAQTAMAEGNLSLEDEVSVSIGSNIQQVSVLVDITGAEGLITSQSKVDLVMTETYTCKMDNGLRAFALNVTNEGTASPDFLYLVLPDGFPMDPTTLIPTELAGFANAYYLNVSKEDASTLPPLLATPLSVMVMNPNYVPASDDDTTDDIPDDVLEPDNNTTHNGDQDNGKYTYIVLIGLAIIVLVLIVLLYRRSKNRGK
jgi:hypothetical protein